MRLRSLYMLLAAVVLGGPVHAAEPVAEFAQALRARGWHDTAEEYLTRAEEDPRIPAETKRLIPYELAVTLQESARNTPSPEVANKQLDRAEALLERFVSESPGHEKAAEARSERGRILLVKAKTTVMQANSPANAGNRQPYQEEALKHIASAREIFQAAHDEHEAAYKKFPTYIPDEQQALIRQREAAEVRYMQAQLDLAKTAYEETQAYDSKDPKRNELLNAAAEQFKQIHDRYRSQNVGLYAQMFQAKCYEEQGEIGRAMGIYNALLGNPGNAPSLRRIQDRVRLFRLICLNHDQRKDYQIVDQEATEWLKGKERRRDDVALGIRYQRAIARETLGLSRTIPEQERERYLRDAQSDAEQVNQRPGQYKDVTSAMIDRIKQARGIDATDPTTFAAAFSRARFGAKQIEEMRQELAKARAEKKPAKEIETLQSDLVSHMDETGRLLRLALELARPEDGVQDLNTARFLLSYVYLMQRRYHEAAVLGEYVARRFQQNPEVARQSAHVAMAAYTKILEEAPGSLQDKKAESNWLLRMCHLIVSNWKGSGSATEAASVMAQMYQNRKEYLRAAHWYLTVPESAVQYPTAQVRAGQMAWVQYDEAVRLPQEPDRIRQELVKKPVEEIKTAVAALTKTPAAELDKLSEDELGRLYADELDKLSDEELRKLFDEELAAWRAAAEKYLKSGIEKMQERMPKDNPSADDLDVLIRGKISLAQILIDRADYKGTLALLSDEPFPVMKAIEVPEGQPRPAQGFKAQNVASASYQLLLRAYVGLQDVENAQRAMAQLETVAGDDVENITAIYVDLGRQLQDQIQRLRRDPEKNEQLAKVLASFDSFLGELFKKKESMPYNQLIWIATTYSGLGEGVEPEQAPQYFEKAADTYEQILKRKAADSNFIDDGREMAVRLRLINCKRRQRDFERAVELAESLLGENPKLLSAQIEAALIFQDWGQSGQSDKFLAAINGKHTAGKGIWGWAEISSRLQTILSSSRLDEARRKTYEEDFLRARRNISWCRMQYALGQGGDERQQALANARREIESFAVISGDIGEKQFFDDSVGRTVPAKPAFESLYREIQLAGGTAEASIVPLKWPVTQAPQVAKAATAPPKDADGSQPTPQTVDANTQPAEDKGGAGSMIVFLLVLVGGLAGVGWFIFNTMQQEKKRRTARRAAGSASITAGAAPQRKKKVVGRAAASASPGTAGPPQQTAATERASTAKPQAGAAARRKVRPPGAPPRKPQQ